MSASAVLPLPHVLRQACHVLGNLRIEHAPGHVGHGARSLHPIVQGHLAAAHSRLHPVDELVFDKTVQGVNTILPALPGSLRSNTVPLATTPWNFLRIEQQVQALMDQAAKPAVQWCAPTDELASDLMGVLFANVVNHSMKLRAQAPVERIVQIFLFGAVVRPKRPG
jgi:hypothetical protein